MGSGGEVAVVQRWTEAQHDDNDVAATVLLLDGRRYIWRATGLDNDPDVALWAAVAAARDYDSLYWRELTAMRSRHN